MYKPASSDRREKFVWDWKSLCSLKDDTEVPSLVSDVLRVCSKADRYVYDESFIKLSLKILMLFMSLNWLLTIASLSRKTILSESL